MADTTGGQAPKRSLRELAATLMVAATYGALRRAVPRRSKAEEPPAPPDAIPSGRESPASPASTVGVARGRARQYGRGREAKSPMDIPWQGWKDIGWRVYTEINDDRVLAVAGGMVFFAILAVVPALAAFISLYGLIADPSTISEHLSAAALVLPAEGMKILQEQVQRLTAKGDASLGFGFAFGLALSIWSANSAMKALFDGLNVIYDEREGRSFVWLNVVSLVTTLGVIAFFMLAIAGVVVLPVMFTMLGLQGTSEALLAPLRWPLLLGVMTGGLMVMYRYGPSRRRARWTWLWPGALLASVLWVLGSLALSLYLARFANYAETYGSLGAVLGFMTWLWLSAIVVLVGGEFNAEIEHQTARDTTEGPPKPLGQRRAVMADSVGPGPGEVQVPGPRR